MVKKFNIIIIDYIKSLNSFSNTCIAYKSLLTILATVVTAKRSISKLKLIKLKINCVIRKLIGLASHIIN